MPSTDLRTPFCGNDMKQKKKQGFEFISVFLDVPSSVEPVYREWATKDTREKKVEKAVMIPLVISQDGAVHRDTVRRWKDFAPDIRVDWVWMAQSVLRYNVVIVGKFFNKGSWVSEAWRKDHPEEFEDEDDGPPERIPTVEERRELLRLEADPESAVCAVFGHATSTERSADVRWKGKLT